MLITSELSNEPLTLYGKSLKNFTFLNWNFYTGCPKCKAWFLSSTSGNNVVKLFHSSFEHNTHLFVKFGIAHGPVVPSFTFPLHFVFLLIAAVWGEKLQRTSICSIILLQNCWKKSITKRAQDEISPQQQALLRTYVVAQRVRLISFCDRFDTGGSNLRKSFLHSEG